jgi:hypothetical protein
MATVDQFLTDRPCSWHWYLFSALLIDTLLGREISERAWLFAGALVLLLVYMTARRFSDIGWHQCWVIPYALLTLSPYAVLLFVPHANVRLITLGIILLQVPAMVWPKKKAAVAVDDSSTMRVPRL